MNAALRPGFHKSKPSDEKSGRKFQSPFATRCELPAAVLTNGTRAESLNPFMIPPHIGRKCKCFHLMSQFFDNYLTECQHCLCFHRLWKELRGLFQRLPPWEGRL